MKHLPISLVEDVMFIAGGREKVKYLRQGDNYHQTVDIVHLDGTKCGSHDIPNLPKELEGFGMASRHDRLVYLCGGSNTVKNGNACFESCGNYFFLYFYS